MKSDPNAPVYSRNCVTWAMLSGFWIGGAVALTVSLSTWFFVPWILWGAFGLAVAYTKPRQSVTS